MKNLNSYLVPASVIIAGGIIALSIFLSMGGFSSEKGNQAMENLPPQEEQSASTDNVRMVTADDHIRGDINAPIKIVGYSDFECPFCQQFHSTLNTLMDTYEKSGEVAIVFRQFPIEQSHSKAPAVALASECVAELGGNDAFWQFADRYFEVSPSNNRTDIETVIPQLVQEIGIDDASFQACFESGRHNEKIQADYNNAVESGGRGTPWSVVIAPNGTTFPLSGSQPLGAIEQLIEIARSES